MNERAAIIIAYTQSILDLCAEPGSDKHVRSMKKGLPTLLSILFFSIHLVLSGFKSLPRTKHLFFAAGIAKGPTPAMTSAITWPGWKNSDTSRSCSCESREFQ